MTAAKPWPGKYGSADDMWVVTLRGEMQARPAQDMFMFFYVYNLSAQTTNMHTTIRHVLSAKECADIVAACEAARFRYSETPTRKRHQGGADVAASAGHAVRKSHLAAGV
jgi:hypothetical protein